MAYSLGTTDASVCSSLSPEGTAERMNIANPTGKQPPWRIVGPSRPCGYNPDTHKHYTLVCREEAPCPE